MCMHTWAECIGVRVCSWVPAAHAAECAHTCSCMCSLVHLPGAGVCSPGCWRLPVLCSWGIQLLCVSFTLCRATSLCMHVAQMKEN